MFWKQLVWRECTSICPLFQFTMAPGFDPQPLPLLTKRKTKISQKKKTRRRWIQGWRSVDHVGAAALPKSQRTGHGTPNRARTCWNDFERFSVSVLPKEPLESQTSQVQGARFATLPCTLLMAPVKQTWRCKVMETLKIHEGPMLGQKRPRIDGWRCSYRLFLGLAFLESANGWMAVWFVVIILWNLFKTIFPLGREREWERERDISSFHGRIQCCNSWCPTRTLGPPLVGHPLALNVAPRHASDREICHSCAKAAERISSSEQGLEQLTTVGTMQSLLSLGPGHGMDGIIYDDSCGDSHTHTYIMTHTDRQTDRQTDIHSWTNCITYFLTSLLPYLHASIHPSIHTYVRTYVKKIYIYTHTRAHAYRWIIMDDILWDLYLWSSMSMGRFEDPRKICWIHGTLTILFHVMFELENEYIYIYMGPRFWLPSTKIWVER